MIDPTILAYNKMMMESRFSLIDFPSRVKITQHSTAPKIYSSPILIFPRRTEKTAPLVITTTVPIKDIKIPVNFKRLSFSLKNIFEKIARKMGFRATMTEALLAVVYFKPEKKQRLSPAIPIVPNSVIMNN